MAEIQRKIDIKKGIERGKITTPVQLRSGKIIMPREQLEAIKRGEQPLPATQKFAEKVKAARTERETIEERPLPPQVYRGTRIEPRLEEKPISEREALMPERFETPQERLKWKAEYWLREKERRLREKGMPLLAGIPKGAAEIVYQTRHTIVTPKPQAKPVQPFEMPSPETELVSLGTQIGVSYGIAKGLTPKGLPAKVEYTPKRLRGIEVRDSKVTAEIRVGKPKVAYRYEVPKPQKTIKLKGVGARQQELIRGTVRKKYLDVKGILKDKELKLTKVKKVKTDIDLYEDIKPFRVPKPSAKKVISVKPTTKMTKVIPYRIKKTGLISIREPSYDYGAVVIKPMKTKVAGYEKTLVQSKFETGKITMTPKPKPTFAFEETYFKFVPYKKTRVPKVKFFKTAIKPKDVTVTVAPKRTFKTFLKSKAAQIKPEAQLVTMPKPIVATRVVETQTTPIYSVSIKSLPQPTIPAFASAVATTIRTTPIVRQQPTIRPITQPITRPKVIPRVVPIVEPITEPIVSPMVTPRVAARVEPIVKPIVEPIVEPVIDPVIRPTPSRPPLPPTIIPPPFFDLDFKRPTLMRRPRRIRPTRIRKAYSPTLIGMSLPPIKAELPIGRTFTGIGIRPLIIPKKKKVKKKKTRR
jgi:hypothetical protein